MIVFIYTIIYIYIKYDLLKMFKVSIVQLLHLKHAWFNYSTADMLLKIALTNLEFKVSSILIMSVRHFLYTLYTIQLITCSFLLTSRFFFHNGIQIEVYHYCTAMQICLIGKPLLIFLSISPTLFEQFSYVLQHERRNILLTEQDHQ